MPGLGDGKSHRSRQLDDDFLGTPLYDFAETSIGCTIVCHSCHMLSYVVSSMRMQMKAGCLTSHVRNPIHHGWLDAWN